MECIEIHDIFWTLALWFVQADSCKLVEDLLVYRMVGEQWLEMSKKGVDIGQILYLFADAAEHTM